MNNHAHRRLALQALLFAAMLSAIPLPQKCQAQYLPKYENKRQTFYSAPSASPTRQYGNSPTLQGATNGTVGPPGGDAPMLPGATNGTVGPRGSDAPMLPGATNGTIGPRGSDAPMLPGATNGTIGPPGADATVISGVPTSGTVRVEPPTVTWQMVAINVIASSLILVVLRRKRADMWMLAAAVGVVMLFAGVACGFMGLLN